MRYLILAPGPRSLRMYNPLWYPLTGKMGKCLDELSVCKNTQASSTELRSDLIRACRIFDWRACSRDQCQSCETMSRQERTYPQPVYTQVHLQSLQKNPEVP